MKGRARFKGASFYSPMKVKMLTGAGGVGYVHSPGDIVEMDDDVAKRYIEAGYAEAAETPREKARKAKTKRTTTANARETTELI